MVSGGLAFTAKSKVEGDTHIYAHYPAIFRVGGNLSKHMGQRIKRPMPFQGLARKEARTRDTPEGDFTTIEGTLDEYYIRRNKASEHYLGHLEDNLGHYYKGRGQTPTYVKHTISAPQDN
eukprot:10555903-Heterocapsa_arctica.AAC.1